MTLVVAAPGWSRDVVLCIDAWPIQHTPATAPLYGRNLSKVLRGMTGSLCRCVPPAALTGGSTFHPGLAQPHDAAVPVGSGTVPGKADGCWRYRHNGDMVYAAVAVGAGVPVALGILLALRSTQARIAWLLLAHGASVGLLLGVSQATGTGTAALALDQVAQGGWVFLFLWLVLVAYLVPDGHLLSARWQLWVGAGLVGVVLFLVGAAGDADSFRQEHPRQNPPLGAS